MQYSIKIFFWILTNDGNWVHRLDTEVQKGMRTSPWPQGTQSLVGERQTSHGNINMVLCFVQDEHIVELMKVNWDQGCDQLPWIIYTSSYTQSWLPNHFILLSLVLPLYTAIFEDVIVFVQLCPVNFRFLAKIVFLTE